jgi:hypothetical protein
MLESPPICNIFELMEHLINPFLLPFLSLEKTYLLLFLGQGIYLESTNLLLCLYKFIIICSNIEPSVLSMLNSNILLSPPIS